jgi:uncharacterized protein (DUF2235 family)
MVPDQSMQVVGTTRKWLVPDRDSEWFGTGSEWKVRLVPDSDSGNLAHKYRMAELVQKGWTHLEVKGYTWKIKTLVHETFSLLAQ